MRGLVGVLVVAATAAFGVPAASAGTYDVVSCGAPGAGASIVRGRRSTAGSPCRRRSEHPAGPGSYVIADQCPSQLFVSSAPPDGTVAPFLTSGNWVFRPRPAPRVTRLETWRFGVQAAHGRQRSRSQPGRRPGRPVAGLRRDEGAQLIGGVFGENCTAPAGAIGCSFGSDSGVSAASRAVYDINVARISYAGVVREPLRLPARDPEHAGRDGQGLRHARDHHRHHRARAQGRRPAPRQPAGASRANV